MQSNDLMNRKLCEIKNTDINQGNELIKILDYGFMFESECVFLRYFYDRKGNAVPEYFQDKTGYEAFVNSFHISDYCEGDFLQQSMMFAENLFRLYRNERRADSISAIISIDDGDCIVKFHANRDGEDYVSGDLNDFNQPVLILKSQESSD